jgi:hypothetical protein
VTDFSLRFPAAMFTTTNFRYLRVSKTSVLPLNLSLSKEDLDWFNERSFQVHLRLANRGKESE